MSNLTIPSNGHDSQAPVHDDKAELLRQLADILPELIRREMKFLVHDVLPEMVRRELAIMAKHGFLASQPVNDPPTGQIKSAADLPPLAQVTQYKFQYFDNSTESKKGMPLFQLKAYAWDCPLAEINRHVEGNYEPFWFLLARPGNAYFRRTFKDKLDFIGNDAQFVGCRYTKKGKGERKFFHQAVALTGKFRLLLFIDGGVFDLGLPHAMPDSAKAKWYWIWRPNSP